MPKLVRVTMHGEGLARAGGAEDCHVCVLVDAGIEYIHDNQGVVVLVYPQKDAVVVTHLKGGKG